MILSSIPSLVTPEAQGLQTWNGSTSLYTLALPLGLLIDRFETAREFCLLYTKFIRKHLAIEADERENMRGAIVFLIGFVIFLVVTLAYPELPLGNMISDAAGVDPDVEWSGLVVRTLASAIFNGVIYGVIIWLIFTLVEKVRE